MEIEEDLIGETTILREEDQSLKGNIALNQTLARTTRDASSVVKKVIGREIVPMFKGSNSSSVNVADAKGFKKEPLILAASIQDTRDEWVLDSGASFHITPNKEVLFDLKQVSGGKVLMGNNTFSEIEGVGKVCIKGSDGSIVILTNVKFMPTMGRNLISYGCLE